MNRQNKQDKNQVLRVVDMSEEKVSQSEYMDERHYRTIYVIPQTQHEGVISTAQPHGRNIWDKQPMSMLENPFYDAIVQQYEQKKFALIKGRIETVEVEPYFIESESGNFRHPETGNPANKVTEKTYVLFEDETVDRYLRADGLTRKGESVIEGEQAQEGVEPADLDEEAPEQQEEVDVA